MKSVSFLVLQVPEVVVSTKACVQLCQCTLRNIDQVCDVLIQC